MSENACEFGDPFIGTPDQIAEKMAAFIADAYTCYNDYTLWMATEKKMDKASVYEKTPPWFPTAG